MLMHYFVLIFFDFCGFISVDYTTLNKLLAVLFTAQCNLVQSAVLRSHVVRLSVCLSVTLVICDHIGWKSWKLISRTTSTTPSLCSQKAIHLIPGEHGENLGETRGRVGKKCMLENESGNISETRNDRVKVTMGAYRNSPTLFWTVPSPTPYAHLLP